MVRILLGEKMKDSNVNKKKNSEITTFLLNIPTIDWNIITKRYPALLEKNRTNTLIRILKGEVE
jgi:hypothetical protein